MVDLKEDQRERKEQVGKDTGEIKVEKWKQKTNRS